MAWHRGPHPRLLARAPDAGRGRLHHAAELLDDVNAWLVDNGHQRWSKETFTAKFATHSETRRNKAEIFKQLGPLGPEGPEGACPPCRGTVPKGTDLSVSPTLASHGCEAWSTAMTTAEKCATSRMPCGEGAT